MPLYPSITDSLGPLPTCENTAHLSSHYWRRWCSNGAHWFQINPSNGQTAGILFHYLSLEWGLTWQLIMHCLLVQLHHILNLVSPFVALIYTFLFIFNYSYYCVSMFKTKSWLMDWFINRKSIHNTMDTWLISWVSFKAKMPHICWYQPLKSVDCITLSQFLWFCIIYYEFCLVHVLIIMIKITTWNSGSNDWRPVKVDRWLTGPLANKCHYVHSLTVLSIHIYCNIW